METNLPQKNFLDTKIGFFFPAQQPIQKYYYRNKRNVSHIHKGRFGKTKSYNVIDISDTTRFFSSD